MEDRWRWRLTGSHSLDEGAGDHLSKSGDGRRRETDAGYGTRRAASDGRKEGGCVKVGCVMDHGR